MNFLVRLALTKRVQISPGKIVTYKLTRNVEINLNILIVHIIVTPWDRDNIKRQTFDLSDVKKKKYILLVSVLFHVSV